MFVAVVSSSNLPLVRPHWYSVHSIHQYSLQLDLQGAQHSPTYPRIPVCLQECWRLLPGLPERGCKRLHMTTQYLDGQNQLKAMGKQKRFKSSGLLA